MKIRAFFQLTLFWMTETASSLLFFILNREYGCYIKTVNLSEYLEENTNTVFGKPQLSAHTILCTLDANTCNKTGGKGRGWQFKRGRLAVVHRNLWYWLYETREAIPEVPAQCCRLAVGENWKCDLIYDLLMVANVRILFDEFFTADDGFPVVWML